MTSIKDHFLGFCMAQTCKEDTQDSVLEGNNYLSATAVTIEPARQCRPSLPKENMWTQKSVSSTVPSGGRAEQASGVAYEQTREKWIREREVPALPQIILHN